jgi:4,5-DOPA dioxygenase extradiol
MPDSYTLRGAALFVSHGAPTFALEPGRAGPLLRQLGTRLPTPQAVLVVSPHWITREFAATATTQPETLHDFGGFPDALYDIRYPAPGDPALAERVVALLRRAGYSATRDGHRGLDHGAWVPLLHLYPQANVPVVQLSMPVWLDAHSAWELGETLAPLIEEGVLILGSGSLTHNLWEFQSGHQQEADYARAFAEWARQALQQHDREALTNYLQSAPEAWRAHPTPDHFLPLLVTAGAGGAESVVEILEGGIEHGVLSMDSYFFGRPAAQGGRATS